MNNDLEVKRPITEAAAKSDEIDEKTPNVFGEEIISFINKRLQELGTTVKFNDLKDLEYGGIVAHNTYISGNVGIGTTSPGSKLAIKQTGLTNSQLLTFQDDGTSGITNGELFLIILGQAALTLESVIS